MSTMDITARGLAVRALEAAEASSSGASLMLNILDHGADRTGAADSTTAFAEAQAALAAQGGGTIFVPRGTYDLLDAAGSLPWSLSHGAMIGEGMDATSIRGGFGSQPFRFAGVNVTDVYIADLTLFGPVTSDATGTVENVIFERVRFANNPADPNNAVKLVADNMAGGFRNITFIDCEFGPCGRMGVELQNHAVDEKVRFTNIQFIRPRVLDVGQYAGQAGMGISLSGWGDNCLIESPYFDVSGAQGPALENVGFNNLTVRNMMLRASSYTGSWTPLSFTNTREMLGNVIDGFRLVPDLQGPAWKSTANRPSLPVTAAYFENCKNLVLRNFVAEVAPAIDASTVTFGATGKACNNVTMENCDLRNTGNSPAVAFTNTQGQHLLHNCVMHNSHGSTGECVAVYGSGEAFLEGGHYSTGGGAILIKTGSGKITVGNNVDGLPRRYRETVTIASGATSSALVSHGLQVSGLPYQARCHVLGNPLGMSMPYPTYHSSNTQARANVATAPSGGSVSVLVEVELS